MLTKLDELVFHCQDASLALVRELYRISLDSAYFANLDELAGATELNGDPWGVNLDRALRQGAPDEIDLEAFVRVAYALGYDVTLTKRENNND